MTRNSSALWDPAFEKLVRSYLLGVSTTQSLAPHLSLRGSGLDSYSSLGLLAEIEAKYKLKFPIELLTFETFETPATLWAAIQKVRALGQLESDNGQNGHKKMPWGTEAPAQNGCAR